MQFFLVVQRSHGHTKASQDTQGSLVAASWASLAVCYKDWDLRFWRFLRELAINTTKDRLMNKKGLLLATRLAPKYPHAPLC